ncbi:hypothetical protein DRQ32_10610 [bacterium]|nr:MAG: hypothetical protein DRQ32_10610 [bacterium]
MPKSIEAADRRPLVYGLFVLLILVAASYLFWPRSPQPESLVLTPDSVRTESAAADMTSTTEAGDSEADQGSDVEVVALEGENEIAEETHINIEDAPSKKPTQTKTATATPAKTSAEPAANTVGSMPATNGKWVLNVGAYSKEANARSRAAEISRQGMSAHVHRVNADGKTLWRVRVGYFATKTKAGEYGNWMKSTHGIEGWTGSR